MKLYKKWNKLDNEHIQILLECMLKDKYNNIKKLHKDMKKYFSLNSYDRLDLEELPDQQGYRYNVIDNQDTIIAYVDVYLDAQTSKIIEFDYSAW